METVPAGPEKGYPWRGHTEEIGSHVLLATLLCRTPAGCVARELLSQGGAGAGDLGEASLKK